MGECAYCGAKTNLYSSEVPICIACELLSNAERQLKALEKLNATPKDQIDADAQSVRRE